MCNATLFNWRNATAWPWHTHFLFRVVHTQLHILIRLIQLSLIHNYTSWLDWLDWFSYISLPEHSARRVDFSQIYQTSWWRVFGHEVQILVAFTTPVLCAHLNLYASIIVRDMTWYLCCTCHETLIEENNCMSFPAPSISFAFCYCAQTNRRTYRSSYIEMRGRI